MKILKRILIIFSITVLTIFLLLLVTPVLFKGKILEIAKRELNNILTAEVDFSDLKLSFIRNFPDAYVALEDLTVTGTGAFEGKTLLTFQRLSATADIISVIRMSNIQVKSVLLDQVEANAHILEDGRANWDIVKSDDKPETASTQTTAVQAIPEEETTTSTLGIALKKFEIRNANLTFRDDSSNMEAAVNDLNFFLHGDMTLDNADLDMKLDIAEVSFWMGGIRLLNNAEVSFISQIAADLKNMAFTFKDNQFNLNEIVLKFAGSVEMPPDNINIDLAFATERTDFKSLLSLIPAVYMQGFESIQTTGNLTLSGEVKGTYNEDQMPNANVSLTVDNAMFKYPDLPKSVDNINIALRAFYDGAVFDNTTVDVDRFNFRMADNPFNAELHVKTPESDMQIAARFAGRIDFDSVADIIPLGDMTLNGMLECDLALAGRMSTLEKEQYEDFDARGMIKLSGFNFESPDFPQTVKITETQLNFTPRRVDLASFDAVIGNSDIAMSGTLENFIPFVFKGDTVRGSLRVASNTIDLNEFMALGEPKPEETEITGTPQPAEPQQEGPYQEEEAGSASLAVIEVPKNIDFTMNVNIGNILFDKLDITNTVGVLLVRDGKVQMQNLAMNLLEGSMVISGEYNTEDIEVPSIDLHLNIRQFDITSALSSFSILEQFLPEPQNYVGKVSANLNLYSVLDEHLSPVLDTVASEGRLQTHNLELRNSKIFGALADFLKNESWRTPAPNNLNIDYEIINGRLLVKPVHFNIHNTRLELSGDQGLDMSLNYRLNVAVPTSAVGHGATDLLNRIPGGSNVREFMVAGLIGGTTANPNVRLDVTDMATSVVTAVRDQVVETVTERVEETAAHLREERDRQVAAIMAEAERQAANIRSNTAQAANRLRSEANDTADRIIREARNSSAIQQRLAQAAADLARKEGEDAAAKLEEEADRQIAGIMDSARLRADAITSY